MSGPELHPLAAALGPGWLWLYRPETDTVILLARPSGAFVELDGNSLAACTEAMGRLVAAALDDAVLRGVRGQLEVVVTRREDSVSVEARSAARERP